MIGKFLTIKFAIIAIIAIVIWVGTFFIMRHYWRTAGEFKMKSDFIKVPINNTLMIMGIVCPLLIGLVSYFYINTPNTDYSFILGSITLFAAVLILAIWETYSLLSKATPEDIITINWSKDSSILIGMGVMYGSLILGVMYLVLFFLFDLPVVITPQPQMNLNNDIAIAKPLPRIGQTKADILSVLGAPSKFVSEDTIRYQGSAIDIDLQFDKMGMLQKIVQQRH